MARRKEFDPDKALEKAMHLFWLQGYEATSVDDLCQTMEIKMGSLYGTFGSKRSLFLAVVDRYLKENAPPPNLLEEIGSAKASIAHIFHHKVDISVNDAACRGCLLVNTIVELAPVDAEMATLSEKSRELYRDMFYQLLVVAKERGEIAVHRELNALALYLTNAMFGLRVMAKTTRDRQVLETIVNTTLSILD